MSTSLSHKRNKRSSHGFILAGDIGGTKTNLGLFSGTPDKLKLEKIGTYSSGSADSLIELLKRFLKNEQIPITKACFGVAGPIINNVAKTTNLAWTVTGEEIRSYFNWSTVILINDLVAMACAIPHLTVDQTLSLNRAVPPAESGNIGLIAAGTGLGEALLIWNGKTYTPCPSEGGHKDFAPRTPLEWRLRQYLAKKFDHVSIERVLSGDGLVDIYRFLRQEDGQKEPEWLMQLFAENDNSAVISQTALAGKDPICEKALNIFVELYGAEAGNLALQALTMGGIYLGGGIGPKIVKALSTDKFINAFYAKGRLKQVLSQIPVRLILDNTAPLWGAASYLKNEIIL